MRGGWSSPTPYTPMDGENKAITTKKKKKKKKKKQPSYNDSNQPVPLDVVLTNGQFILPRCDTLMFTTASLRLLTK